MDKTKYYDFKDILDFLCFDANFKDKCTYPFNKERKDVIFSWGQLIIPKKGIRETVQNKISGIEELPINELVMMYQIPFKVKNKQGSDIGLINQNITLTFRYDKTYKYGNINKSIYECCFYILEHGEETNDFFIITNENLFMFFSYYIMDNQFGFGSLTVSSPCTERYFTPMNSYTEYCNNCCYLETGDKCSLEERYDKGNKFAYTKPEYNWIWKTKNIYECGKCGHKTTVEEWKDRPTYKFCPNCGVTMKLNTEFVKPTCKFCKHHSDNGHCSFWARLTEEPTTMNCFECR